MSSVVQNLTDADMFASTLPLSVDDIKAHSWEGYVISANRGFVMASIWESQEHPGYFHCRVCSASVSETKKPVIAEAVGITADHILGHHGALAKDLKWKRSDIPYTPAPAACPISKGEIVYFLRAGDFVKIGKATGSPTNRLSQLRTGCPFPIEVVATIDGGYAKERELHERFRHIRAHGEWFHATADLCAYIESLSKEVVA